MGTLNLLYYYSYQVAFSYITANISEYLGLARASGPLAFATKLLLTEFTREKKGVLTQVS